MAHRCRNPRLFSVISQPYALVGAATLLLGLASLLRVPPASGQAPPVRITVDATHLDGRLDPVWSFFGYDEPNYTYAPNGRKLLGELRKLSDAPVYVRVHNLLTTGDGSSSLKWGSTNAYTEDAAGNPVYDWKIIDRIFDTFRDQGVTPLVEVGFMPEALSTHPQPYRHNFPTGSVFTGWSYPPRDYGKWQELAYQFAKHLRDRYGDAEVKSWLWEVWNEPDIDYWHGSSEEFFQLYDFAAAGILKAVPDAKIGGPDTTGAAGKKAAEFLQAFLQHCAEGRNQATGQAGAPLAFISFHPKGAPTWLGDHVRMGLGRELLSVQKGFAIVAASKQWKDTPIILGEWDPEGCAACSAKSHPENAYRNGELYAAYTAEALKDSIELARLSGVRLAGLVSWSFEFEDQPYFEGFRELATNGIDKPVLDAFRMFGMLGSERLRLTSTAAASDDTVHNSGNGKIEGIDGIAARKGREIEVLLWNYREEYLPAQPATIELKLSGLSSSARSATLEIFRVDRENSNAYSAWQKMGSPLAPTPEQYRQLEFAGHLKADGPPVRVPIRNGEYGLSFRLPEPGLALVRLRW
jgi:xylan 1,4-beta-xylosidase